MHTRHQPTRHTMTTMRSQLLELWRIFNATIEDLPRRMDDWVHTWRKQQGMPPDQGVEQRRAKRSHANQR